MILDQFKSIQTEYLKTKDMQKLGVLRFFLSQIQNKEIELRPQKLELTDEVIFKVLKKIIKQKKEAIEMCNKAGREDTLKKETEELTILEEFVNLFPDELKVQI